MLPLPPSETHARFADHARCRRMLREGSLSFHAASRVLPERIRGPVTVFYAFCRLADDGVDRAIDKTASLIRLRRRLVEAYQGTPINQPVDRAFADLVSRYPVPKTVIDLLFEGFEWDCDGRHYQTASDVRSYSVRVAGTVGVIMALLMGVQNETAFRRACDLGVAMQLTNIARDVGEDANAGRLYLPRQWLEEEGIDPDTFLARPAFSPSLGRVIGRLLDEARHLYVKSEAGIAVLPAFCRPAIYAARYIYADIARQIGRAGLDSVSQRAFVSGSRKLALIGKAGLRSVRRAESTDPTSEMTEGDALTALAVQAVQEAPPKPTRGDKAMWALELMTRSE